MEELLLDKNLLNSQPAAAARSIARTRTLIALRRLDGERNQILIQFLRDAGLLGGQSTSIIDLSEADLRDADLMGANLQGANLHEARLQRADLREAYLWEADLTGANLGAADLRGADLRESDLTGAILRKADLAEADLLGADLRRGQPRRGPYARWLQTRVAPQRQLQRPRSAETTPPADLALQDASPGGLFFVLKPLRLRCGILGERLEVPSTTDSHCATAAFLRTYNPYRYPPVSRQSR
jgi:uncharacterized protein YjbI with pentapeptide repeats